MTPSTPPGDWEVVDKALLLRRPDDYEYTQAAHMALAAASRRRERETQMRADNKLLALDRLEQITRAEAAERERDKYVRMLDDYRKTLGAEADARLAAEALVAENDEVHQDWIDRTNRAEARVKELEEVLRDLQNFNEDWYEVQRIARRALAHEEAKAAEEDRRLDELAAREYDEYRQSLSEEERSE